MKIVVLSAHPDDAETGAGGFCARAAQTGHDVLILHISKECRDNRIDGKPEADVRTAEAAEAARILGVRVAFFDHYMGECPATRESSREMEAFLRRERPELVLTQWPVDTHPDHQVVGILPLRPYVYHRNFCLAFYEVCAGIQTIAFAPNRLIDISPVLLQKRAAVMAHRSQSPEEQVAIHEKMSAYRGLEMGVAHAEAFQVLGGLAKTAFDTLFAEVRNYGQSGGIQALGFPPTASSVATGAA